MFSNFSNNEFLNKETCFCENGGVGSGIVPLPVLLPLQHRLTSVRQFSSQIGDLPLGYIALSYFRLCPYVVPFLVPWSAFA